MPSAVSVAPSDMADPVALVLFLQPEMANLLVFSNTQPTGARVPVGSPALLWTFQGFHEGHLRCCSLPFQQQCKFHCFHCFPSCLFSERTCKGSFKKMSLCHLRRPGGSFRLLCRAQVQPCFLQKTQGPRKGGEKGGQRGVSSASRTPGWSLSHCHPASASLAGSALGTLLCWAAALAETHGGQVILRRPGRDAGSLWCVRPYVLSTLFQHTPSELPESGPVSSGGLGSRGA